MVLPRYLRCLTLVNVVSSMTINGGRWGVGVWCRLVEHLGLAKTDCQAEELGGRRAWSHLFLWATRAQSSAKKTTGRRVCRLFVLVVRRRR